MQITTTGRLGGAYCRPLTANELVDINDYSLQMSSAESRFARFRQPVKVPAAAGQGLDVRIAGLRELVHLV
jgi:hypothetical protein